MRILFLAHSHSLGAFRVGSHHYARELSRAGADVVHLSTPISRAHTLAGRVPRHVAEALPPGPWRDETGTTYLVPRTTLPVPYGRFRVARELRRHGIAPAFDAVLIDQPLLWDASVRPLAPVLVYRPTDLYPRGVKQTLQRRIVAASDGVVATSAVVLGALGPLSVPTRVIENGVDVAHFSGAAADARHAACVYVGALDGRFDWDQLTAWAQAYPDVPFRVAGPMSDPPVVPANVVLLGPVDYDDLPALLHSSSVGLLPLSDSPLNSGRSPMKLYEYLAAGLAVVARETPVLRADGATGLFTYDDRASAEVALRAALALPTPNLEGSRRATQATWKAKAAELADFLAACGAAMAS